MGADGRLFVLFVQLFIIRRAKCALMWYTEEYKMVWYTILLKSYGEQRRDA